MRWLFGGVLSLFFSLDCLLRWAQEERFGKVRPTLSFSVAENFVCVCLLRISVPGGLFGEEIR